jgi:quinoprotein relay system zinc metallohydrolase 1
MKKWLGVALLLVLAQYSGAAGYELQPRAVAADTWVIEGAVEDFAATNQCNIINTGFIVTEQGVLVINTGPSRAYGVAQRQAIARITSAPVVQVLNLNLHPDYFLGNQAYEPSVIMATALTREGQQREGDAYVSNLFRICGESMKGTEARPAPNDLKPGSYELGNHHLELLEFKGHTASDMVLMDRDTGVVFAGGLIFNERIPTTPHAHLQDWLKSLDQLAQQLKPESLIIPSHGPIHQGLAGLDGTRAYLLFLDLRLAQSARELKDLNEVLALPVPEPWKHWGGMPQEYRRNVVNLYPAYESGAFH